MLNHEGVYICGVLMLQEVTSHCAMMLHKVTSDKKKKKGKKGKNKRKKTSFRDTVPLKMIKKV